ncbi:hypothetical protein A2U01_0071229, partial [Trifolium medium]|nr:hypothetical protein [Trifolium medium]
VLPAVRRLGVVSLRFGERRCGRFGD